MLKTIGVYIKQCCHMQDFLVLFNLVKIDAPDTSGFSDL